MQRYKIKIDIGLVYKEPWIMPNLREINFCSKCLFNDKSIQNKILVKKSVKMFVTIVSSDMSRKSSTSMFTSTRIAPKNRQKAPIDY